jgi:hypothetical protein
VARQHAVSVHNRSSVDGRGRERCRIKRGGRLQKGACSRRARRARSRGAALRVGQSSREKMSGRGSGLARAGAEGGGARCARRGVAGDVPGLWPQVAGMRRLHKDAAWASYSPNCTFLAVSGCFTNWSKERKIDYVDAEHAPEERLVSPSLWPSLSVHVVASLDSHTARRKGAGSVTVLLGHKVGHFAFASPTEAKGLLYRAPGSPRI